MPVDVGGNITTIVGTGVEIRCTVTGKPTPSITWLQNGSVVEATSVRFINRLTKALTLLGVSQDDSGFYTCFANNTFGQVSETTHLTIFGKFGIFMLKLYYWQKKRSALYTKYIVNFVLLLLFSR